MMEWGIVKNFLWLWVIPASVAIFWISSSRKRHEMKRFGDLELMERLISSFSPTKRFLKRVLFLVAITLIVLALCQPHFKKKEITVERKGVDVMIAVDVSNSMLAKDISPSRLEKSKLELAGLVDKLKGDRIGIVAFAGEAMIQCPLTFDRNAAKLFLTTLSPNLIPTPGTAIAKALKTANQAFSEKEKEFKVIVLLTDGEDHDGNVLEQAKIAKEAGVKIFAIGIGTSDGSTLLGEGGEGFKKDRSGNVVLSKLNEKLLRDITAMTGGVYYHTSTGDIALDRISNEIKGMIQKGFKKEKIILYDESYQWLLFPAIIILLAQWMLSERKQTRPYSLKTLFVFLLLPFLFGFKFWSPVENEEGNKLYQKGQVGKAKRAYLKAQKSDPQAPEIAFNLGNAYYKEEDLAKSKDLYKQAAQNKEKPSLQSKAFYNLGNTLAQQNDIQKAIEFYKHSLRLNPKDVDAKYNLEILLNKENDKKNNQDQNKDNKDQKKDQNKDQSKDQNKDQNQNSQNNSSGQSGNSSQNQESQGDQKNDSEEKSGQAPNKDSSQNQDKKDGQDGQSPSPQSGESKDQENSSPKDSEDSKAGSKGKESNEEPKEEPKKESASAENSEQKNDQDKQEEGVVIDPGEVTKPKSSSEQRAEQILAALGGQEEQVLKMGNEKKNRRARAFVDKDW